ncbi:MAG: VCBS repeat-containing protein [bacterium]|nr:VCBS repeat-containing protein [bacterium]
MMNTLVWMLASTILAPQDPALLESKVTVTRGQAVLALRDFDGDGDSDLLRIDDAGVSLRFFAKGHFPPEDDLHLAWPSERVAWDLTDLDGDGTSEVMMITDGREVRIWRPTPAGFGDSELLLEASSYLPAGVSRMDFARDVDGDGMSDIVLPESGRYRIHLRREEGWAAPIEVAFEPKISYTLGNPRSLSSKFGQSVSLPWFSVEDIDGDGHVDLVSRLSDEVAFHIARGGLPAEPTWTLDLAGLRDQLPDRGDFDFDDLLSNIPMRVEWRIADLDGKAPNDLVLMLGSTFKVYWGGSVTGPNRSPDQLLKSSGNVLHFFVRDVLGDGLPELQISRGERISLGRVLRYLILPGKVDFDLFTYQNDEGTFSMTPTKRATLSLAIPRLLSLMNDDELEVAVEAQLEIPALRTAFDDDGVRDDVVDLRDAHLVVYTGCAPDPADVKGRNFEHDDFDAQIEELVLKDLDELEDGGTHTVDLGALEEWILTIGAELRAACEGKKPLVKHALLADAEDRELFLRDVDGDGRDDYVVIEERKDEVFVTFLVRPAK